MVVMDGEQTDFLFDNKGAYQRQGRALRQAINARVPFD